MLVKRQEDLHWLTLTGSLILTIAQVQADLLRGWNFRLFWERVSKQASQWSLYLTLRRVIPAGPGRD